MSYKKNPKTKGSGIICCIPQTGECPQDCEDCFFQSGRSYLEPLDENLPNMPPIEMSKGRVVRINDGNDSNVNKTLVINRTWLYNMRFFNTSIPHDLEGFSAPVVLTINPGKMTDNGYHRLDPIPKNLMFVRIRTNMWNIETVVRPAIEYYTNRQIPVVLTFMAYHEVKSIPDYYRRYYLWRERTSNSYHAIKTSAWEFVMSLFKYNEWVHSCGKIEGELGITKCRHCGNCLREYFATMERLREC